MNEDLQTIVDSQAKEIAELKSKLSSNNQHNLKDEIVAFYERKYLEIFDEVYTNRLDMIASQIQTIEQDIEKYALEEQKLTLVEDANKENIKKQEELEKELSTKFITLEETRFSYDNKITKIQNDAIKLYMVYSDYIEKYRQLLTEYEIDGIDQDTFLFSIYDIVKAITTEGYLISINLKEKENEVSQTIKSEEEALFVIQKDIEGLKYEIENLKKAIQEVSYEETEKIREELTLNESRKADFKKEIADLYQKKKKAHLKMIEDEATRFTFLGYDSVRMSEAFEDLLVVFKQELLSIDTESNKTYQREKREKMLNEELEKLKKIDNERSDLESEYNYLKNIYADVMKKIKEIEEYNSRLMNVLSSKAEYLKYLEIKKEYESTKGELVAKIKEQNKNYTMLQDKRRIAVCDPFSKTPLSEIDEEIVAAKKELDETVASYKEKEKTYDDLSNNPLNVRILNLLKQKGENEKNLTRFYIQLNELKDIIDSKYDEIKVLKDQLKEYQHVSMQLEELKNENNN